MDVIRCDTNEALWLSYSVTIDLWKFHSTILVKCRIFCRVLTPNKGLICEMRSKTLAFWSLSCVTVNICSYVFLTNFRLFMIFCCRGQCLSSVEPCSLLIKKNPFVVSLWVHVVIFFPCTHASTINSGRPPHFTLWSERLNCVDGRSRTGERVKLGRRQTAVLEVHKRNILSGKLVYLVDWAQLFKRWVTLSTSG